VVHLELAARGEPIDLLEDAHHRLGRLEAAHVEDAAPADGLGLG